MKESVTYHPKLRIKLLYVVLIGSIMLLLLIRSYAISAALIVLLILGLIQDWYSGLTVNSEKISRGLLLRRVIKVADIESVEYKDYEAYPDSDLDPSSRVFVLKKHEPKIAGVTVTRRFTIALKGWSDPDRRSLFSQLLKILDKNNVKMDIETRQKLIEAAAE
jgi:hypothetical protein